MRFVIKSEDGSSLSGTIAVRRKNSSPQPLGPESVSIFNIPIDGLLEVDLRYEDTHSVMIWPSSGHASVLLEAPGKINFVTLKKLDSRFFDWWRNEVGARNSRGKGFGVNIAVIDTGFQTEECLSHVGIFDSSGERIEINQTSQKKYNTHASDVTRIIGARSDHHHVRGIAPNANLLLFIVKQYRGKIEGPDAYLALEACFDRGVDIVNISFGISRESCEFSNLKFSDIRSQWSDLKEAAKQRGALIIAAAGNSDKSGVCLPACEDGIVGVSGIGLSELGEPPAWVGVACAAAQKKADRGRTVGRSPLAREVFANVYASSGEGIDCCAPSIGVGMQSSDGRILELTGTSFAAPIVTGTLASRLSDDPIYFGLKGANRAAYAKRTLESLLFDLNLDVRWQGRGMPTLRGK